jgi:HSP20 family molecular chaperone IbpA
VVPLLSSEAETIGMNVEDGPTELVMTMRLPGLRSDDTTVVFHDEIPSLVISCEEAIANVLYAPFRRSYMLPISATRGEVRKTFAHETLRVHILKSPGYADSVRAAIAQERFRDAKTGETAATATGVSSAGPNDDAGAAAAYYRQSPTANGSYAYKSGSPGPRQRRADSDSPPPKVPATAIPTRSPAATTPARRRKERSPASPHNMDSPAVVKPRAKRLIDEPE